MKSHNKKKTVEYTDVSGEEIRTAVVRKMPLGRYAELFEGLKEIPQTISGVTKMLLGVRPEKEDLPDTEDPVIDAFMAVPAILAQHWNDLVKLLSIASEISEDEIAVMDLDEAASVVFAIIEVNNFFGIKGRYQALMTRMLQQAAQQTQMKAIAKAKKSTG